LYTQFSSFLSFEKMYSIAIFTQKLYYPFRHIHALRWNSQSLLVADFKENQFSGFKNPFKKSAKQENPSLFINSFL